MAVAVNLKSTDRSARKITELWDALGKLEPTPSMRALNYPPHFTFAIYDKAPMDEVLDVVSALAVKQPPLVVQFSRICTFEASPEVIWIAPDNDRELAEIHAEIHAKVNPTSCHVHYQANEWIPHCTVAMNMPLNAKDKAVSIRDEDAPAFTVTFDAIDCVEFPPVSVIKEFKLKHQHDVR